MSRKYKFHNKEGMYFVSFATVYWIDVFVREEYFIELVTNLQFCVDNKGLKIYAWCIMPSHVHLIFSSDEKEPGSLLGDYKSFTSKKLQHLIKENPVESRREWMTWIACPDFFGI